MIAGSTGVYALLGHPVAHSRSPALHNGWFATHGMDAVYVAFDTVDPDAIDAAFRLGLAGLNITTPLKAAALARAASAEPAAVQVGAANTLVRRPAGWHAANTDVEGLCRALEAHSVALRGRRAAVIGAGGAARAAVVGLAARGAAAIDVLARRPDRAEAVAALVGGGHGPIASAGIADHDLVIIATAGRADAVAALDPAVLAAGAVWFDTNYWDPDPPGLRAAHDAGCRTVRGDGMLRHQAALSFEAWTGVAVDPGSDGEPTAAGAPG